MINKIKLLVAFLVLCAGVAAFYLLADKAMLLRIFSVIAGLGVAGFIVSTTPSGRQSFSFIGESIAEAKRVVWPTRKETIQTTLIVFVLVIIMAAFLGLVDIGFAYMVQWLMGRSA